ncbi:hypothetical protein [Nonomuraea maritima]|uniref:hypothetical protein n=1 Tax=Nonomuraea maritima TaxID=683260 RepID=UPI00115FD5DF|nr:hypothetical protein [Nonomuraea maritima]
MRKRLLCRACNERWQRAGRPDTGPPPPSKGGRPRDRATDERAAETKQALADGTATLTELAERFGVTHQTVMYYRDRAEEE